MKARIKETGEVARVYALELVHDNSQRQIIHAVDCELTPEDSICWEKRRYELAMAAIQGMLSNSSYDVFRNGFSDANKQVIVSLSIGYADEAVKQLKGGQG